MLNFVLIYKYAPLPSTILSMFDKTNPTPTMRMKPALFRMLPLLLLLLAAGSCYRRNRTGTSLNYEVTPLPQGVQGTVNFKVSSYGYDPDDALERCKMDAVHAILFKGIPGSNQERPLITNPDAFQKHRDYFATFFGIKDSKDISTTSMSIFGRIRLLPGNAQGPYRLYVSFSNDGSINPNDRTKVDNRYKVGVPVSVNVNLLRTRLEQDGILRKLEL
jgi:hypothetical protein